jgi:hypothetical protein
MIQVGTFNYLFRLIGALSSPSSAHLQNCPRFLSTTNVATASFNACAKAAGAVRHAQLIANLDSILFEQFGVVPKDIATMDADQYGIDL